jgi:hypothetical protein
MVKITSEIAYFKEIRTGKAARDRLAIYQHVQAMPGCTRNELSRALKMPINVVSGRVNDLLNAKALLERGTKVDPITGGDGYCLYVHREEGDLAA